MKNKRNRGITQGGGIIVHSKATINEPSYGKFTTDFKTVDNLNDELEQNQTYQTEDQIQQVISPDAEKPAETEQKDTAAKYWRIVTKKIIGWIFKKTSNFICAVIITVVGTVIAAIVVDIFADFGWIERIKRLFTR